MKANKFVTSLSTTFHKAGFQLKKHSPEILVAGGVIGVVVSGVMACKATLKVSEVINKAKEDIDTIHDCVNSPEFADEYTVQDSKRDLTIVYAQTGLKLVKLYAPAIAIGTLSLASILASNNILRKRNVALAAAYTAVDQSFKDYRKRVVDRFGEVVDRELQYNIKAKEVEETVVNEKTGKEKKVKKTVQTMAASRSPYCFCFDEASEYWEKDPTYNLMFVRAQQQYANDLLRSRKYLFLNDVLKMLGLPVTKAGQILGWVYDPDSPNSDCYVDFGIWEPNCQETKDFVNGYERSVWLEFNVDGNIWELMDKKQYADTFSN